MALVFNTVFSRKTTPGYVVDHRHRGGVSGIRQLQPFVEGATFSSPANREEMLLLEVIGAQSAKRPCFPISDPQNHWVPRITNQDQSVGNPGSEALF
jgi:hypothetical protein